MKRQRRQDFSTTRVTRVTKTVTPSGGNGSNLRKVILGVSLFILIAFTAGLSFLFYLSRELPSLTKLERIDPAQATQVYSANGELLHGFFTFNRTFTPFDKIPESAVQSLIATEDRSFYDHWGINLSGVVRAILVDIAHMEIKQGASTITMQLARNLYFGYEQKITRKLKEALTAIQIERTYSKNEILEMYFNVNSFGNNAYGIQAAARRYFDKTVEDLGVEESALLVGILKGPTWYSPIRHPERALQRRNLVLNALLQTDNLTQAEFDSLKNLPLNMTLKDPNEMETAPYFTEYIRRQLNDLQDSLGVNIYEDGLRVYTTLNPDIQKYMEQSVKNQVGAIQNRVLSQNVFRTAKKNMSDSAFAEFSTMQIAFVAVNPKNGHILAMIGGRDFSKSKFNRVTQMKRQPGSAFKPFLYTAAIDNGYTPADQFLNQPTVEINPDGTRWTPKNFEDNVGGLMTIREALRASINLVAVRLISEITPKVVAEYARNMGITTDLRPFSSLALGSSEVIPLEIVSAYGAFANNGVHVKPVSILKIEDKSGNIIYQSRTERKEVLSPETAFIMNNLLQYVVNAGTGYNARGVFHFMEPAGGKTGTTNDNTNAWFIGFSADIVAGVWVGMDDFSLNLGGGMTGSVAALPFWADFMKMTYDSVDFARHSFPENPGVLYLKICQETKKLASPYCPSTYEEYFHPKYQPTEICPQHKEIQNLNDRRRRRF